MKTDFYSSIYSLQFVASCVGISQTTWEEYMKDAKKADKRRVNRLVKKHLPELYNELALDFYNPYNYFKNDRFIIVVHSAIEYFIQYN